MGSHCTYRFATCFFYFTVFSCKPESFPIPNSNCRLSHDSDRSVSHWACAPTWRAPARPRLAPHLPRQPTRSGARLLDKRDRCCALQQPLGHVPARQELGQSATPGGIYTAPAHVGRGRLGAGESSGYRHCVGRLAVKFGERKGRRPWCSGLINCLSLSAPQNM